MNMLTPVKSLLATTAFGLMTSTVATAVPVVIEDFADTVTGNPSFGTFVSDLEGSGSSGGVLPATAHSISSTQWEFTPAGQTVFIDQLSVVDDATFPGGTSFGVPVAWTIRHLSNGGSGTAANLVSTTGGNGFVGYYLRTTAESIVTAIALDEVGGSGGTEISSRVDVINDGEWHLYQFNLADANQWDGLFGAANGTLDGTTYSIDSVFFYDEGPNDGDTSRIDFTYISADAQGPLVDLTPEPTSLALLACGSLAMLGRRRQA